MKENHLSKYSNMVKPQLKWHDRPDTVAHVCNPSLWEAKAGGSLELRIQDQPGQHGKTPSLPNYKKLAGHVGVCLWSQLLRRLRWEDCLCLEDGGCRDHATTIQPGLQSETSSQKIKK